MITDKQHADAAVMNFVRWPETFDVVVASNLFGDILTDLGGVLGGGLGFGPERNLNPERTFPSMFEPVHGSAPGHRRQRDRQSHGGHSSAAMMLEWLGEERAASRVRNAVERAIATGHSHAGSRGGQLSTSQHMADHVLQSPGGEKFFNRANVPFARRTRWPSVTALRRPTAVWQIPSTFAPRRGRAWRSMYVGCTCIATT